MFGMVIWHFHISTSSLGHLARMQTFSWLVCRLFTSSLTELCVFWRLFTNEDTLWCLSQGILISLAFNPGHIWIFNSHNLNFLLLSLKVWRYCWLILSINRVVVNRQANKLWFLVKVVPKKTLGDVKVCDITFWDYLEIDLLIREYALGHCCPR